MPNKYQLTTIWNLADKGCEMMGWYTAFLGLDAQLCAAQYYLDDIMENMSESSPTFKMWERYQSLIAHMRKSM